MVQCVLQPGCVESCMVVGCVEGCVAVGMCVGDRMCVAVCVAVRMCAAVKTCSNLGRPVSEFISHDTHIHIYGVATISRLLKIIGLFCKRAL